MKLNVFVASCLSMALACAAHAQSANAAWTGVWQGELDGQPGVTLTLAEDTGELGGTVVLNLVAKEKGAAAHVIGSATHVLMHPHLQGDVLTFEVKQARSGREMRFSVTRTADGKAQIQCLDCGPDSPVAPLERVRYGKP